MATDAWPRRTPLRERAWWPAARRTGTALFLALVAWLVVSQARTVAWGEVFDKVRAYPAGTLAAAMALAVTSHALYASFDLLSRRYAGHHLATSRVVATTFISYAFNLNLGALVGGLGFRLRLYAQQGLAPDVISRVFAFTMLTNWIGYMALGGALALVQPIALPEGWALGAGVLRVAGAAALAFALGYPVVCALTRRREWTFHGHRLRLPSARLALAQLVLSTLNWSIIGGTVYLLVQQHTPQGAGVHYPAVLSVLLAAALAGVITHVPAGLGVLEAVFVALLSPPLARSPLLAALLVYRALYYLLPLALASLAYLVFEWRLRRAG